MQVCFVNIFSNTQGRLGTHEFDLILPPLGICYLASVLEQEKYSVGIVDGNAELLSDDQLLERVQGKAQIVGIYCHTQNFYKVLEIAERLKAHTPETKVIIGGPHPTALPAESVQGVIDAVVFGEGELTIVELVPKLLNNESLEGVQGVAYRDSDGQVRVNEPRELIQDIDTIPMPAWHLLPMHRYSNFIEASGRTVLQVMGSRGCKYDCNYCYSPRIWHQKVRWHSVERVMAEVDHLQSNYGIKFIEFLDDNFTLSKPRLRRFIDEFGKRKMAWTCSTRIDLIDDEVAQLLAKGRVDHVCIGIETVNDRLLLAANKGVTKAQTIETIERCERHKVPVFGMFIIGLPTETIEEARESVEFSLTYRFWFAIFSFLTIYPGTNYWAQYRSSKFLSDDFSRYDFSKDFNFIEDSKVANERRKLMRSAFLRFCTRPRVVFFLAWLMIRNPKKAVRAALAMVKTLFRLIFKRKVS